MVERHLMFIHCFTDHKIYNSFLFRVRGYWECYSMNKGLIALGMSIGVPRMHKS